MEFATHLIPIPRRKDDPSYSPGEETSFQSHLNYLCNSFRHHHGEPCDLIVVGEAAGDAMSADEDFMAIVDTLPCEIMVDDELAPLEGYACIRARPEETARSLLFVVKPSANAVPLAAE